MAAKRDRGRPLEFDKVPRLADLVEAMGGLDALADRCHVSRRTMQRWGHGEIEPSYADKLLLAQVAKEHALPAPFLV